MSGPAPEQILLNEVQVLLAEQRTFYTLFRLGIGVITLPLTVTGFLIATREYHEVFARPEVAFAVLLPLAVLCVIGIRVRVRMRRTPALIDRMLGKIKFEDARIAEILVS